LTRYGLPAFAGLLLTLLAGTAHAQPKPQATAVPVPPAPTPPAAATGSEWNSFPTMLLEKVYRAPLRDTVVQRWRDPIDGSVCFLYIPISTPMLPQPAEGFMQYGPNQIGSISCIHPTQVLQLWQGSESPPPVPAPATRRR
jgi:hypothetical protein